MWRPRTEAEIQVGIENGAAVESASFDAKRELPPSGKNKDLAKDICAMTVDGGTLLYGVGGDDPTRPDTRGPFATQGARERVDSVAQTGISEPPVIDVYEIDSDEQPGSGYLCIVVPPSPRAPHMLTIDGDNRYWGRGLAGNRILTEREVARLYDRRGEWEADRGAALEATIAEYPFEFDPGTCGVALTTVIPVAPGRELLRIAAGDSPIAELLTREMTDYARSRDPYPDQGTSGLGEAFRVDASQADLWVVSGEQDRSSEYQAYAEFAVGGLIAYWHSPLLNTRSNGETFLLERSLTRAVFQPLAVAEWLYVRAGFFGSVDVAVAVMGIDGVGGATRLHGFSRPTYGAPEYRRHERITGEELRGGMDDVVRRLLRPLYEVISVNNYDPFGERRQ
jgi:hypothetical protein